MILTELAGGVALGLERSGQRAGLSGDADVRPGLADGRQPGAQGDLAGDQVRAAGGAACLGVVVSEQHAFFGELIELRRLARHNAAVIGANVEPADVVAHYDEDVGLLAAACGRCVSRGRRLCQLDRFCHLCGLCFCYVVLRQRDRRVCLRLIGAGVVFRRVLVTCRDVTDYPADGEDDPDLHSR